MKPLADGELRYKDRKVDPATFNPEGKDLRRLVGRCRDCGKVLRGVEAVPMIDSYASDIDEDYTPVVQCEPCDLDRAQDA